MSQNLKDILSHLPPNVDQETLLRYLQGKLSAAEQHQVEQHLLDAEFEADAVEGLQQVQDEKRLQFLLDQLHHDLRKKTAQKQAFRDRLKIKEQPVLWAAILLVLFLIIISYLIVQRLQQA